MQSSTIYSALQFKFVILADNGLKDTNSELFFSDHGLQMPGAAEWKATPTTPIFLGMAKAYFQISLIYPFIECS